MKGAVLAPSGDVIGAGTAGPDRLGGLVLERQLSVHVADDDPMRTGGEDRVDHSALTRSQDPEALDLTAKRFELNLQAARRTRDMSTVKQRV